MSPNDAPESFRLLVQELRYLTLKLNHFLVSKKNFQINKGLHCYLIKCFSQIDLLSEGIV